MRPRLESSLEPLEQAFQESGLDILRAIEDAYIWPFVQGIYDSLGWLGTIILMVMESACIPLSSGIIMPLAGQQLIGAGDDWLGIFLVGTYGAAGSTIGSIIAYWIGAKAIRPLLENQGKYSLVTKDQLHNADRWVEKYGGAVAFFARLVPVVRTFISLPAGIMRMNLPKFVIYTYIGSFLWAAGLAWAGELWSPRGVREAIRPFDVPIILIILALAAWLVIHNRRNRNKQPMTTQP